MASYRFGIDLGGTKIEIAALDQSGEIVLRQRSATPVGNYAATINAIRSLIKDAQIALAVEANQYTVGVGIPGAISPATGLIKNANSTCLIGQDLKTDLSQALEKPVRLENDANCLALSEAIDGAGAGANNVFAVILGTGVGGGIVFQQQCLHGPNAIVGEWGHNPLPWMNAAEQQSSRACYCGKPHCIETWLSGGGLRQTHFAHTSQDLSAEQIAERSQNGDVQARNSLEQYAHHLAKALAGVINILDPEVIVLGGGLSNIPTLYEDVPTYWGDYVFSDRVDTDLRQAKHGDSSGVRGAAWLWESV